MSECDFKLRQNTPWVLETMCAMRETSLLSVLPLPTLLDATRIDVILILILILLPSQIPLYQRHPPDMRKVTATSLVGYPRVPCASVLVRRRRRRRVVGF